VKYLAAVALAGMGLYGMHLKVEGAGWLLLLALLCL
jgi:hypothetical protein